VADLNDGEPENTIRLTVSEKPGNEREFSNARAFANAPPGLQR
jgi:hypothetical protein